MENNKELFQAIFNRNLWDAETPEYLENIAGEHPYFSPAQFYLLLQTNRENPAYKKQVQKTAALFNNNYWLNYLMTVAVKPEPAIVSSDFKPEETIADVKAVIPLDAETVTDEKENPETEPIHSLIINEPLENKITDYDYDSATIEAIADEKAEINNKPIAIIEEAVENSDINYSSYSGADLSLATEEPTTVNEVVQYEPTTIRAEAIAVEENLSLKTTEAHPEEEEKVNEQVEIPNEPAASFGSMAINETTALPAAASADDANQQLPAMPEKEIAAVNSLSEADNRRNIDNTDAPAEALLFEPLHTSDYFASVGIKLSEEANSSDRLGKQLKSFTQWLKTMKKIDTRHSDPLLPSEIASENIDSNIQTLAERSNKEDEIITEAMADVLVQQGRINKAVEVLKKLSLLNPSKSTYFAAKIDQLKD